MKSITFPNWISSLGKSFESDIMTIVAEDKKALIIHLFRTLRQHCPHFSSTFGPKIQRQVAEIVARLRSMPNTSLAECSLLLPFPLAGSEAEDDEQCPCSSTKDEGYNRDSPFSRYSGDTHCPGGSPASQS